MRMSLHVNFCDVFLFILDDGLQQVSCSCCQPMDLVDMVVPLICQDGHTIHHTIRWATVHLYPACIGLLDLVGSPYVRMDTTFTRWAVTATSRSHMSGDGHTMHSPYSGEPQLLPAILSSVRMDTPFATKPGVLSSCHTMDFPWVRSLVVVKRLCFRKHALYVHDFNTQGVKERAFWTMLRGFKSAL